MGLGMSLTGYTVRPSVLSFIITKPAFAKVVGFIYTLSEPAVKKEKAFPFARKRHCKKFNQVGEVSTMKVILEKKI